MKYRYHFGFPNGETWEATAHYVKIDQRDGVPGYTVKGYLYHTESWRVSGVSLISATVLDEVD